MKVALLCLALAACACAADDATEVAEPACVTQFTRPHLPVVIGHADAAGNVTISKTEYEGWLRWSVAVVEWGDDVSECEGVQP